MSTPTSEEQIRALALRLWEEAGRPDGRSEHFWALAQRTLASKPGMESAASNAQASGESLSP